ncbi:hypothetical protein MYU51_021661 [Penicillium brevicompactum]
MWEPNQAPQPDGGGPEAAVPPASEAMLPTLLEQLEGQIPSMECDRFEKEMMRLGLLAGHIEYRHVEKLHVFVRNISKLPPFALDIGLKQICQHHPYFRNVNDAESGEQAHESEEQSQNRETV